MNVQVIEQEGRPEPVVFPPKGTESYDRYTA